MTSIVFCLLLSCGNVVSFDQPLTPYQVSKVELKDVGLKKALRDFARENELEGKEGAIILKIDKLNADRFYASYLIYKDEVERDPPSYYSVMDGEILILIYTGFESHLMFDKKSSFKKLFNEGRKNLLDSPMMIRYHPVMWKFDIIDGDYKNEVIEEIPW